MKKSALCMTYSNALSLMCKAPCDSLCVVNSTITLCCAFELKFIVLCWHHVIPELKEMLNGGENLQSLEKKQEFFQK